MKIKPNEYKYFAMNKPEGYISALKDPRRPVLMELFHEKVKGLHIVGRLDKDTTGLIILTNDGSYTHSATHPKKHVEKTYIVSTKYKIEDTYKEVVEGGMKIDRGLTQLKPGKFEKINDYKCEVTISEGKYHQVKKMFLAFGNFVEKLHRSEFDGIILEELNIKEGEYIEIPNPKSLSKSIQNN